MPRNRLYFAIVAIILLVAIIRINQMNKEIETEKEQSSSELNCPGDIDCDGIPDEQDKLVTESQSVNWLPVGIVASPVLWNDHSFHVSDSDDCKSIVNPTDEYVFVKIEGVEAYLYPDSYNSVRNHVLLVPGDRAHYCSGRKDSPITCEVARPSTSTTSTTHLTWTSRGYLRVERLEEVRCSVERNDRGDRSICIQPPDGSPPSKETHCGYRSSP